MDIITKKGVRILRPSELDKLINAISKDYHRLIIKSLFYSGMRFRELQRFNDNPQWLLKDTQHIHLPPGANLKVKCKQSERWISLNPLGYEIISQLVGNSFHLPGRQTLNENLQRWGLKARIGDEGICIKMFRKSVESWLMFYYPNNLLNITLSMGHNELTSLKHYLNLPFTPQDKINMSKYIGGYQW